MGFLEIFIHNTTKIEIILKITKSIVNNTVDISGSGTDKKEMLHTR